MNELSPIGIYTAIVAGWCMTRIELAITNDIACENPTSRKEDFGKIQKYFRSIPHTFMQSRNLSEMPIVSRLICPYRTQSESKGPLCLRSHFSQRGLEDYNHLFIMRDKEQQAFFTIPFALAHCDAISFHGGIKTKLTPHWEIMHNDWNYLDNKYCVQKGESLQSDMVLKRKGATRRRRSNLALDLQCDFPAKEIWYGMTGTRYFWVDYSEHPVNSSVNGILVQISRFLTKR